MARLDRFAITPPVPPMLAKAVETLPTGGKDVRSEPQHERRAQLERLLKTMPEPIRLTAMTGDRTRAADWLQRFEGAGLDGVVAKLRDLRYAPGKRVMFKIKHVRTA